MKPVYLELLKLAANGAGFYIDDTHAKILTQMMANKKATNKKGEKRLPHDRDLKCQRGADNLPFHHGHLGR